MQLYGFMCIVGVAREGGALAPCAPLWTCPRLPYKNAYVHTCKRFTLITMVCGISWLCTFLAFQLTIVA